MHTVDRTDTFIGSLKCSVCECKRCRAIGPSEWEKDFKEGSHCPAKLVAVSAKVIIRLKSQGRKILSQQVPKNLKT